MAYSTPAMISHAPSSRVAFNARAQWAGPPVPMASAQCDEYIRGTVWLTHDAMHLPLKTKALFELAGHGTSTVTLDVHNELLNGFLGNRPWHVSQ